MVDGDRREPGPGDGKRGLPAELKRLKGFLDRALAATADLWGPIRVAYGWTHRMARILGAEGATGAAVRANLGGLPGAMLRHRAAAGPLGDGVDHFLKVSRSYWPGLFACYDTPDRPRANNDLEQLFGSHRHHERRCSGRKVGSPGLVVRGSVRLVAGLMTRLGEATADDLVPADLLAWQELRQELGYREAARVQQRRFRRDPPGYLKQLEALAHQSGLPA